MLVVLVRKDRMDEGLEIVDAGGAGETDRMDEDRIVEQSCENGVCKLGKNVAELVRLVPQERAQQIDERFEDVPVSQILEEVVGMVEVPLPQGLEEVVEEFKIAPQDNFHRGFMNRAPRVDEQTRVQRRTAECMVGCTSSLGR